MTKNKPGVNNKAEGWLFVFSGTEAKLLQEVNTDIKMSEKFEECSQAPAGGKHR
jgi:hypothetical protein